MALKLRILYRGPLSSCNYDCHYCPFAKRHETAAELRRDRESLARFVDWIQNERDCEFSILFTPWGEGLTRSWYREAIAKLSHLPNVVKVAIQTNIASDLSWLHDAQRDKVALWCTYHPSQTTVHAFLLQCTQLELLGVKFSVGMVGLHESFDAIEAMRRALPAHVYLWINAFKDVPNYYTADEIENLERVDSLFRINLTEHESLGAECVAGEKTVTVDGHGEMRRCHFVRDTIGNIYQANWREALRPRTCPNATCGCYIGYMSLPRLEHEQIFGAGLLERIPADL